MFDMKFDIVLSQGVTLMQFAFPNAFQRRLNFFKNFFISDVGSMFSHVIVHICTPLANI